MPSLPPFPQLLNAGIATAHPHPRPGHFAKIIPKVFRRKLLGQFDKPKEITATPAASPQWVWKKECLVHF